VIYTTGRLAMEAGACRKSYERLAAHLGPDYGLDTPIGLDVVPDVLGLDDCLWALHCVRPEDEAERDRLAWAFACDCAERVLSSFERERPDDLRPRAAIAVARRFAAGAATRQELDAAGDAAGDAAREVWAAAKETATAGAAAWAAKGAADRAATWAAEEASAGAAWASKEASAGAAWTAEGVAARAAERAWQAKRLRELLCSVPVTVST
jgi:hypothetical protein